MHIGLLSTFEVYMLDKLVNGMLLAGLTRCLGHLMLNIFFSPLFPDIGYRVASCESLLIYILLFIKYNVS